MTAERKGEHYQRRKLFHKVEIRNNNVVKSDN